MKLLEAYAGRKKIASTMSSNPKLSSRPQAMLTYHSIDVGVVLLTKSQKCYTVGHTACCMHTHHDFS